MSRRLRRSKKKPATAGFFFAVVSDVGYSKPLDAGAGLHHDRPRGLIGRGNFRGFTLEIKQSRHSNRIGFVFKDDELQCSLTDSSGSRSFSVPYTDISRDRQTREERNQWLRNVGLLWIAIGVFDTATAWFGRQSFVPSYWLLLGAACYAVYRFRTTNFTILPTDRGNVLVIDDVDGPRVINEIETRRAAQYRQEYDFVNAEEVPEQQRNRFKWLHREGALSDAELHERLLEVDVDEPVTEVRAAAPAGLLLN